jgi:hypothetical protein
MSDDWAPGDLALCVNLRDLCEEDEMSPDLREGGVYTVEAVVAGYGHLGIYEQGLRLVGVRPTNPECIGFSAQRFRKIKPDPLERCETEFITLMNRIKIPAEARGL